MRLVQQIDSLVFGMLDSDSCTSLPPTDVLSGTSPKLAQSPSLKCDGQAPISSSTDPPSPLCNEHLFMGSTCWQSPRATESGDAPCSCNLCWTWSSASLLCVYDLFVFTWSKGDFRLSRESLSGNGHVDSLTASRGGKRGSVTEFCF